MSNPYNVDPHHLQCASWLQNQKRIIVLKHLSPLLLGVKLR